VGLLIVELTKVIKRIVMFEVDVITIDQADDPKRRIRLFFCLVSHVDTPMLCEKSGNHWLCFKRSKANRVKVEII